VRVGLDPGDVNLVVRHPLQDLPEQFDRHGPAQVDERDTTVWIPAGAEHQHQAYGLTDMRGLLFPAARPASQRTRPTVVAVSGLLRELILALIGIRAGLRHVETDHDFLRGRGDEERAQGLRLA